MRKGSPDRGNSMFKGRKARRAWHIEGTVCSGHLGHQLCMGLRVKDENKEGIRSRILKGFVKSGDPVVEVDDSQLRK